MGCPLTWITLSLLHHYWVERAKETYNKRYSKKYRTFENTKDFMRQPYVICGDDLAGLFSPEFYQEYEKIVKVYNGHFSPGKHFKSRRYGIFTEIMFTIKRK